MFEKNLQDLVKGIRSTKGDLNVYISQCLQDIKTELKSNDPFLKAEAVRKLTYLHMLGYDMTWAAFHVVEVMSYERFAHKRVGYTAAAQSFTQSTDVVLLCTNLLKKEFGSYNEYDVGLAINVLANIVTTDLARDLLGDVVAMMNSPKAYVRKKATLALYKMFLRYPQGLRLTFDKLKERMDEPDVSVVSCAVNVICELANKKPKNYLGLAPQFFRLLTTSSNNWMLIKVVKLLASLVPEEPRLARKLLDPLATVIQNTPAKSLLYECIATVTTALMYTKKSDGSQPRNVPAVVRLCNDHLRRFIEDPDQNLRYLGLVGLSNLMESHPYVITEHQELIVECLAVDDITIRMRALDMLARMVTPDNAAKIIRELMRQTLSADGVYRQELIARILDVCSVRKYENIHDFEWYIQVLVQLARVPSSTSCLMEQDTLAAARITVTSSDEDGHLRSHGIEIARQFIDIAVRVKSVRSVLVESMIDLLMEKEGLAGPGGSTLAEVYYASAWIAGEYVNEYLDDVDDEEEEDDNDEEHETIEDRLDRLEELADAMLQARTTSLPAHVQTVFLQTLLKLVAAMSDRADDESCDKMAQMVLERVPALVQSEYIEVQERAMALQQILLLLGLGLGALSAEERANRAFDQQVSVDNALRDELLQNFYTERLAPVGARAQRKVPLPMDLDLDTPWDESEASFLESGGDLSVFASEDDLDVTFEQQTPSNDFQYIPTRRGSYDGSSSESSRSSDDEDSHAKQQYAVDKERARTDPFYLTVGEKTQNNAPLDRGFAEIMDALGSSARKGKSKSKKHASKKSRKQKIVLEDDIMPEGAGSSEEDRRRSRQKGGQDDDALADVDLTTPLRADEKIPDEHLYHRQVPTYAEDDADTAHRKKHHHKKMKESREDKHGSSKKKKSKSSRVEIDENEDKDEERRGKHSKKSSHKSHKHTSIEEVTGNDSDLDEREHRHHAHRSGKKSSGSHKHGESGKDKGSSSKKTKSHKSAPHEDAEPLLLF